MVEISQTDGVVKIIKIDPRPRILHAGHTYEIHEHKSGAETNWTDKIEDRFKNPFNRDFATTVPGCTGRVEAHQTQIGILSMAFQEPILRLGWKVQSES